MKSLRKGQALQTLSVGRASHHRPQGLPDSGPFPCSSPATWVSTWQPLRLAGDPSHPGLCICSLTTPSHPPWSRAGLAPSRLFLLGAFPDLPPFPALLSSWR